jgi:hypothetical protein
MDGNTSANFKRILVVVKNKSLIFMNGGNRWFLAIPCGT